MPRPKTRKKTLTSRSSPAPAKLFLDPLGTGMPALDSIIGVKEIRRGGKVIRIIKTNETDSYDEPPPKKKGRKPTR